MSPFDNFFTAPSLRAANLQKVVDDMAAAVASPANFAVVPDTIIVPPGLLESFLHSARIAVERLSRRLARPIQTGRYDQRRRRRVEGVWASRLRRRRDVERELIDALLFVELLEEWLAA